MPCDWEGNRRSGTALANMAQTSVVYPPTGSWHSTYTPRGMAHFTLPQLSNGLNHQLQIGTDPVDAYRSNHCNKHNRLQ